MGFSQKVKEDINVASARHCCVCHRYRGVKVEIHHIVPQKQGGKDTFENAITLCYDCHSDAGHYFAGHPKGVKLSPTELRKHKSNWFRIVEFNQIPVAKESLVHSRYFVTQSFDFIKEIANKDLSNFPEDNTILLENKPLQFVRNLLKNQTERREIFQRTLRTKNKNSDITHANIDDYVELYPDAKKLKTDDNEYTFFYHTRNAVQDDLSNYDLNDDVIDFLIQNDIPLDKLAKVATYLDRGGCCGSDNLIEELILNPLFFKYLLITNISSNHLKLSELSCKSKDETFYPYASINHSTELKLPNVLIKPNQNVLIPLGCFLLKSEGLTKSYLSTDRKRIGKVQGQSINHIEIVEGDYEITCIGVNYIPLELNCEFDSVYQKQEIHEFDFSNVFWVDRYWMMGSCPHLFFIFDNEKIKYQGEILNKLPNEISVESFTIKEGINKVIIAELEQETTHIHYIKVNGISVKENITLIEGQSIEFAVTENDKIEIKGFYSIESEEFRIMPRHQKQQLIESYKSNYVDSQFTSLTVHH